MEAIGFVELPTALVSRRRWSDEAKGPVVAEASITAVTLDEVARRRGVKANPLSVSDWPAIR